MKVLIYCFYVSIFIFSISYYSLGQHKVDNAWEIWEKEYKSYVTREQLIYTRKEISLSFWRNGSVYETIASYYQSLTDSEELIDELKIDPSIRYKIVKAPFDDSEHKKMTSELDAMKNPEDRFFLKMPQNEQNEYLKLWKKRFSYYKLASARDENKYLTDAQKKTGQEIQIMFMRHYPLFITPRMFNALDLNAEQKLKLNQICQKLEPEYKEYIDKLVESEFSWQFKLANKISETKIQSNEEFFNLHKKHKKEYFASDEWQELLRQKNLFIAKLEKEVSQILTDKQLQRMNELINNPFDSVKKCIKVLNNEFNVKSNRSNH
ncbi:MAG: hypothetical protein LBP59_14595 [Planctomycetaceae bacterium]|nr:hypothetical protein [Planctomycetaceae bacterium]